MRLLNRLVATCLLIDVCSTTAQPLHNCKDEAEALKILQRVRDPDILDEDKRTPLHLCKNENIARALLKKGANPCALDKFWRTPLHYCEDEKIARMLLKKGAYVDARDESKKTPLHFCQDVAVARLLVEKKADPNARGGDGRTPLHYCKDENIAWLLLAKGGDVNARDKFGRTPLHFCRDVAVARLLLEKGAHPNARDGDGRTPLHYCKDENMTRLLLAMGGDIKAQDQQGRTALHICTDVPIARLLLESGADPNARDRFGRTPLHVRKYIARILLENGADPNARDGNGRTPLHYCNDENLARLLLKKGVDVNARDRDGRTPLHTCYVAQTAQILLESGADLSARACDGKTPLHTCYSADMFRVMLEYGAKVKARTKDGLAPLDVFAENSENPSKAIPGTLEQCLDIDATDNEGRTALSYTMERSPRECVKELLSHGASINVPDNKGRTPLYFALTTNVRRNGVIDSILDCVNVEARLFDGSTLLHLIARWGARNVRGAVETIDKLVTRLRSRGLDVDIHDANGRTPLFAVIDEDELETRILMGIVRHLLASGASIEQAYLIDQKVLGKIWRRCRQAEIDCTDVESQVKDLANKLFAADLMTGITDFVPDVVEKYQVEVEKLKIGQIYREMSHYNFLRSNDPFISKTIMDENNDLAKLAVDFPAYGNLLRGKIKLDSFHAEIFSSAKLKLESYLGNSLPSEMIDEILHRLTNAELWKVGQSRGDETQLISRIFEGLMSKS